MKAYTVNNHLVGVGNDQILGTDQGGGGGVEYEAGQYISIDENNIISVTGVAPVTALPTTELGKFTIQSNVSGGPIEVLIPTDVAPVSAFYDLNAQYDDALSDRTGTYTYYYVFKSPGYDNDTWSANTGDVIQLKVNESIQGLGSIIGFYASNSTPASSSAPTINYPASTPLVAGSGALYTVEPGVYTIGLGINPAGSAYGKYITLMVNKAGSGTYVDNILDKIEFTLCKPNAALGTTVNLSRYYLGNTVNSSTPSSDLACQVTVDSTTKQQTVYLPGVMPSSWTNRVARYVEYGSNRFSPSYYSTSQQHIAYKYTSSPTRYQYAYCTDWDQTNELMTFIAYDNSGQAIEKWTLDYTTYNSNVWTTEAIETGVEYTAGDYISIASGTISVTGVAQADWDSSSGPSEILNKPTEIQLIAGANVQVEVTGASAIISAQGGGGGHEYTAGPGIEINNYEISTTELASGLQLVAGKGVTLTVSGNNIVAGLDETVLYTASSASDSITTSEEVTHFERLRIELQSAQSTYVKNCLECKPDASNLVYTGTALIPAAVYPLQLAGVRYTSSNGKNFTFNTATRFYYRANAYGGDTTSTSLANSDIKDVGFITKIVGINRISS